MLREGPPISVVAKETTQLLVSDSERCFCNNVSEFAKGQCAKMRSQISNDIPDVASYALPWNPVTPLNKYTPRLWKNLGRPGRSSDSLERR